MKNKILYCLILITYASHNIIAQDLTALDTNDSSTAINSISLGYILNTDDSTTRDISLILSATKQLELILLYSDTNTKDPEYDFDSFVYVAGITYNIDDDNSFAIEHEKSGQIGHLELSTIRANVSTSYQDWNFTVLAEQSNIDLFATKLTGITVKRSGVRKGLGTSIIYFGFNPVILAITGAQYNYDFNPKLLNSRFAQRRLSVQTISQAGNLLNNYISFNLNYFFSDYSISVLHYQSISAIDDSRSITNAVRFSAYDLATIDLALELGQLTQDNFEDSYYTLLSTSYNW